MTATDSAVNSPQGTDPAEQVVPLQTLVQVSLEPPPPYCSMVQSVEELTSSEQVPIHVTMDTSFVNQHLGLPPPLFGHPLDRPPSYSFRDQQNGLHRVEQQTEGTVPRHRFVLHAYTLLLVLLMLTLTLVATSKVLPAFLTGPIYKIPWLYYISVAAMAASLVVLVSWNMSSQKSCLDDVLLLTLWGGTTLNLILSLKPYTMLSISLAACLTLVAVLFLTLAAIQTRCNLASHVCVVLVFLLTVAMATGLVTIIYGGHVAQAAIQGAWIAAAAVVLPLFTQIMIGGRGVELPLEDFLLAVAILYTFTTGLFQHGLFFLGQV